MLKVFMKMKNQYCYVGSWAIWDTNSIDNVLIFENLEIISNIKPHIVFVGLNISEKINRIFGNFQRIINYVML